MVDLDEVTYEAFVAGGGLRLVMFGRHTCQPSREQRDETGHNEQLAQVKSSAQPADSAAKAPRSPAYPANWAPSVRNAPSA